MPVIIKDFLCAACCRINKRGDHGECGARASNKSLGANGDQGQSLVWGQDGEAPLKIKSFCPYSYKRGAKVKDLNEIIILILVVLIVLRSL